MSVSFETKITNLLNQAEKFGLTVPHLVHREWMLLVIYGSKALDRKDISQEACEFFTAYYAKVRETFQEKANETDTKTDTPGTGTT